MATRMGSRSPSTLLPPEERGDICRFLGSCTRDFMVTEHGTGNTVSGPALPPGFVTYHSSSDDSDDGGCLHATGGSLDGEHGPCPKRRKPEAVEEQDDSDDGFFGPALPPGFKKETDSPERHVIGPALPPGFVKPNEDSDSDDVVEHTGNTSESDSSSSEGEDGQIGPKPAYGAIKYAVVQDFERRAQKMKEKLTSGGDESNEVTRESWMTELPPELTNFGVGPRTFKRRTNEKSGDRSIWTDTPADREKKAKEKEEGKISTTKTEEEVPLSHRDQRLAEQVSTYNDSKRAESLIDIHRKKLKQKAKEDKHKPQERRPFDRDQDLHVNRFDDAQKKALLNKSRELNTKFSHGKSNMFL